MTPTVKNVSGITMLVTGMVLLCLATLDWASYTRFVLSLIGF